MKMADEDCPPRRDGLFEHRAKWSEVRIGSILAHPEKRSQTWEVVDIRQSTPSRYGYTNWFRVRDNSGGEWTIEPKPVNQAVTILTEDPRETTTGPVSQCSDIDATMILVRELGADVMATHDSATGEVVCPDYISRSHIPGYGDHQIRRGLLEHLEFAHGETVNEDTPLVDLFTAHDALHQQGSHQSSKDGFPHRHSPEELWLYA